MDVELVAHHHLTGLEEQVSFALPSGGGRITGKGFFGTYAGTVVPLDDGLRFELVNEGSGRRLTAELFALPDDAQRFVGSYATATEVGAADLRVLAHSGKN